MDLKNIVAHSEKLNPGGKGGTKPRTEIKNHLISSLYHHLLLPTSKKKKRTKSPGKSLPIYVFSLHPFLILSFGLCTSLVFPPPPPLFPLPPPPPLRFPSTRMIQCSKRIPPGQKAKKRKEKRKKKRWKRGGGGV